MRAVFEKLQTEQANSFIVREFMVKNFDAPFHFHPAYELTLILRGEGLRYVGTQVNHFFEGDLVFLGANLPHCWINREADEVGAVVIQFEEDFLGKEFMDIPEMREVREFLKKASSGMAITGKTKQTIAEKMKGMVHLSPVQKITSLLDILGELALTEDVSGIDYSFFHHHYNLVETARFQKVFSFMIEHFKENISLEQIAQVAGLTPTSFCRYFKELTQQTFMEVLIDYRVQYACQLLEKSDYPIVQVAYESGFGDVSYFNKVFRRYKSCPPLTYRKNYRKA